MTLMTIYCNIGLKVYIHMPSVKGYSRKKYLGEEDSRRYIFLLVASAESFQIIWVKLFVAFLGLNQFHQVGLRFVLVL